MLSGTDYGAEMDQAIFSNVTIGAVCPYSEAWVRDFRAEAPSWREEEEGGKEASRPDAENVWGGLNDSAELWALVQELHVGVGQCRKSTCCLSVPDPGDKRIKRQYNTYEGRLWRMPACELR